MQYSKQTKTFGVWVYYANIPRIAIPQFSEIPNAYYTLRSYLTSVELSAIRDFMTPIWSQWIEFQTNI